MDKNSYFTVVIRKLDLPSLRNPIKAIIQPVRKQSRTAKSELPPAFTASSVMIDIIAFGPIVMSLQEPRKMYTNELINPAYKPYWGKKRKIIKL